MHDKHEKNPKKALQKKNRYHQHLYNLLRLRRGEEDRVQELEKSAKPKSAPAGNEKEIWSEKVSTIRNRLDGSKRTSKERWNRFAGTESGGGRGL